MRTGWADNARLRDLVQRTDPGAHLIAEVVTVDDAHVKDLKADWVAGTASGSVTYPDSGGARLVAGTTAEITQSSDNSTEIDQLTPLPPFDALLIEWKDESAEERELKNFIARLHPRPDGGEAKDVAEWRCQAFRVVEFAEPILDEEDRENRTVVFPISREVIVAAAGETVGDITFDFFDNNEYPRIGGPPAYREDFTGTRSTRPFIIIRVIALDSDGNPAENVAWMADSTLGGTISGAAYNATHYEYVEPNDQLGLETGGTVWNADRIVETMPRFTLNAPTYTVATITFDGAEAVPDLSGTGDLEIVANGRAPDGSSNTFKIWNGAAYIECKSGDIIGEDNSAQGGEDLSGVSTTGPWNLQVLMTPSTTGRSTPNPREFGIRRVTKTNLAGLASVNGAQYRIDPVSLKGNIPKAEISILKTGAKDYRDYGTDILALNHIGEIEVRLWIGENAGVYLDRSEWMLHSTWEIQDYRNEDAAHVLECVSPIRRLRTPIPEFVVTGGNDGTRTKIEYTNQTPKAVWDDIVDGRVGLPGRFRGPGVEETGFTISKIIEETDAKNELDRVAYLVGHSNIESQGKIRAVEVMRDGVGAGTPVAFFPIGSYNPVHIGPGYSTRTDEFFVKYDWDEEARTFDSEIRKFNATAFTKLGGAGLTTTQKLETETAKWIDSDALAILVANRIPMHFGNGLIEWEIQPIYLHPHLEIGDVVMIETDQFVARSPITDREIRGPIATLAMVSDTHADLWGRHLTLWVPGFDGIVTSEGDITWLKFKSPVFSQTKVVFLLDGSARFQGQIQSGLKVKAAYSAALPFPNAATVDAASLQSVDAVGYFDFEIAAAGVFDAEDTIFVSAFVYEKADGSGARSTPIAQVEEERQGVARLEVDVDFTTDTTKATFTVRSYLDDTLSGVIEFLDPERTFAAKGAITATDKTLTITDGDLTNEDVGKYVSVAGAGAAGALLESRIDTVTSATEAELEDAAGTTVANANVILGGGYFQDFDYSGTPGNTETNFRNRPANGVTASSLSLRAVVGTQTTTPEIIILNPILPPTITAVRTQGHDDSADIDWTTRWEKEGSTNSTDHDLTIEYMVDGLVVEQETGVSVDESQPYLHSSTGEGGLPGSPVGSARLILERKSDNSTLDSKDAKGNILTT